MPEALEQILDLLLSQEEISIALELDITLEVCSRTPFSYTDIAM